MVTVPANTTTSFYAAATDVAGNVSSCSSALEYVEDSAAPGQPPAPDLDPASDSGVVGDRVTNVVAPTIVGTAEAGATVDILVDGTTKGSGSAGPSGAYSIPVASLSGGTHTIVAGATDSAGNQSPLSAALTITIDTVAPTPSIDDEPPAVTNDSTPQFSFSAELGATFECSLSSGAGSFSACTSPKLYGAQPDSAYTFRVRATDAAGNTSAASAYAFAIDTVAPPVTLGSRPASPSNDPTPQFGFSSAEAGAAFECSLSRTTDAFAACTSPKLYGAQADGTYTFKVRSVDAAGNRSAAASHQLVIDTVAPAVAIGLKPPVVTNDSTAEFTFSAELGATFLCSLSRTTDSFAACTSPKVYDPQLDGSYTFKVSATDAAGNSSPAGTYSFRIDTVAPSAPAKPGLDPASDTGASSSDGVTAVATPRVTGTAEPGAVVIVSVDGGAPVTTSASGTGGYSLTLGALTDGIHAVTAIARDDAGNASPPSAPLSLTVDTSAPLAPSVPDLDPATDTNVLNDNVTSVTTPTFKGTAEAGARVRILVDGTERGAASANAAGAYTIVTSALTQGVRQITATATDPAGNQSTSSAALPVTIDTTAPSRPGVASTDPPSPANANNVRIKGSAEAGSTVRLYTDSTCTSPSGGAASGPASDYSSPGL
ncbi:MAG: Ig-like domain-containing protein, partial [Chloroflexota bacterium]|nr:Ig-like domain-containing protein [Chloroflexota bacterium]